MCLSDKERHIIESLDGLIAPCDSELNVNSNGYTLKTNSIENLVIASIFINDAVNKRFADRDTSQKEPIIIPKDEYADFVNKLMKSAKSKSGILDDIDFRWWMYANDKTVCQINHRYNQYIGVAIKHPTDIENEYIGKSLSFNRAFDKLEDAVNGVSVKVYVGTALSSATLDNYVNIGARGNITRCITGADIDLGDAVYVGAGGRVYPMKSDDITITMTRKDAEELYDTVSNINGNVHIWLMLLHKLL